MQSNYLVCFTLVCSTSKLPFHICGLEFILRIFKNSMHLNTLFSLIVQIVCILFLKLVLFKLLKCYDFVLVKVVSF